MKQAQIPAKLFIFLIGIIIVSILLVLGFKWFSESKDRIDATELALFERQLQTDIQTIASDFGTIKTVSYATKPTIALCLVDTTKKESILQSTEINQYPLMKDSIQSNTGDNTFIYSEGTLIKSFPSGSISIEQAPFFTCISSRAGSVEFMVEGRGNGVIIHRDGIAESIDETEEDITFDDPTEIEEELDFDLDDLDDILSEIENLE